MILYKNLKRPRLTLQERLSKNKQYLKRRLLRISKRAGWLKRKLSKRLKHIIKDRRVQAYYSLTLSRKRCAHQFVKIKKAKLKTPSTSNKFAKAKIKFLSATNKFNTIKAIKKILSTKQNNSFQYFN